MYERRRHSSSTEGAELTPSGTNIPQAIRRSQEPDNNITGGNEAIAIPNPLSPIETSYLPPNRTQPKHVLPPTKSNQSKPGVWAPRKGSGHLLEYDS
ncbi:hypothetical protein N7519_001894 [Penicillium mononematosum]|uniref:uncharacterized protein n=1 Tax=Penicillium mononematosum TaxID=268346 RepID=UPI00254867A5|nr:uncharacterized protein N7519_001894 [Penicillium mononematosum]KAJ6186986.1 hypothetical protein N7519_001894 [Penicillium mononematosum]